MSQPCFASRVRGGRATLDARVLSVHLHRVPCCRPLSRSVSRCSATNSGAADGAAQAAPSTQQAAGRTRRSLLLSAGLTASLLARLVDVQPSLAYVEAPAGYRTHVDKLDGYAFVYPEDWTQVTSSGNDIFLRNPFDVNECLFVDASSPSSSRYDSLEQLGTPEKVAAGILDRYLTQEFMSTRIGIRREGHVLSAASRQADDGRTYYDIAVQMTSYASRSQYGSSRQEVMREYGKEWDRVLFTTLGVANRRLYELRLQAADPEKVASAYGTVAASFRVRDV